jgi:hypothetical protein
MALKLSSLQSPETLSKYFVYVALANMVIAVAATAPILVPQFGLPLKLQVWPGTWMFVAYFSFLIAGVVGFVTWAVVLYFLPRMLGKQRLSRYLSLFHIAALETGVLGATALMGIFPGYYGGTYIHDGVGQFIVTRSIEWAVIPIGLLISVALIATLVGVLNVLTGTADN